MNYCENQNCEMDTCSKRHPRICTYFQNYQRCKFGTFCAYRHIDGEDYFSYIDELKQKIEDLMIQVDILDLEKKMMEEKIECFEKRLSSIENTMVGRRAQEAYTPDNANSTTPLNDARIEGTLNVSRRSDHLCLSVGASPPSSYQTS